MTRMLPDGTVLTEQHLLTLQNEAKEKLRKAIEGAYIPSVAHAEQYIKKALAEIIDIYVKYGFMRNGRLHLIKRDRDKVTRILTILQEQLLDLIDDYAIVDASDSERDAILVFLSIPFDGLDTEDRVKRGLDMMLVRLEDKMEIDARHNDGIISGDILTAITGIIGVGTLKRLVETEVSRAWQYRWRIENRDARYVHVFRGSSYPCTACDDAVRLGWVPIEKSDVLPPIHPNCRCYVVYK